ncbi:MAG TPA: lysylphosphatidylglycerol synthase domain-containing protein [Actinomycetales bacterium]|nr:lysylphosphatidylglycerol synthase domain-containing protein [Actinomycetales bacterium]
MTSSTRPLPVPAGRVLGALGGRWTGVATTVMVGACVALVAVVPSAAGSSWHGVLHQVRGMDVGWLVVLTAVWWAGLWAHSFVLTASLPGLTSRRAIGLNLAGSAVANSVPLGGGLSVAVTSAMISSWGFNPAALGAFLTVSTVANLVVRLAAGAAALVWLTGSVPGSIGPGRVATLAVLVTLCLVAVATCLSTDRAAATTVAWCGRALRRLRRTGDPARCRTDGLAGVRLRHHVVRLVRRSWLRLGGGMVAYILLLSVLLDLALHALGTPIAWPLVLATVALERLVTAVPVTPGGVGIAELTVTGCLAVAGAPAVDAAAGALVYRLFTYFIEIPVGLLVAGAWGWAQSRAPARPAWRAA